LLVTAGKHVGAKGVVYMTGKKVEIDAESPVEVQVDGDEAGWTPVKIEIMEKKLAFILPAEKG
jgi:diacylglycerol kinase family enzyme